MTNNVFLILLLIGAVILGAIGGYFVFLGVYQEQFSQQDRITLENFESAQVVLYGTITEATDTTITIEREGTSFRIATTEDTFILVPDENAPAELVASGRPAVKEGTAEEIPLNQTAEIIANYRGGKFEAVRITVSLSLGGNF